MSNQSLMAIQIATLQQEVENTKAQLNGAISAVNQMSAELVQRTQSNNEQVEQILTEAHNDIRVLANALDSFMRYVLTPSDKITQEESDNLIEDINKFLNRG